MPADRARDMGVSFSPLGPADEDELQAALERMVGVGGPNIKRLPFPRPIIRGGLPKWFEQFMAAVTSGRPRDVQRPSIPEILGPQQPVVVEQPQQPDVGQPISGEPYAPAPEPTSPGGIGGAEAGAPQETDVVSGGPFEEPSEGDYDPGTPWPSGNEGRDIYGNEPPDMFPAPEESPFDYQAGDKNVQLDEYGQPIVPDWGYDEPTILPSNLPQEDIDAAAPAPPGAYEWHGDTGPTAPEPEPLESMFPSISVAPGRELDRSVGELGMPGGRTAKEFARENIVRGETAESREQARRDLHNFFREILGLDPL